MFTLLGKKYNNDFLIHKNVFGILKNPHGGNCIYTVAIKNKHPIFLVHIPIIMEHTRVSMAV